MGRDRGSQKATLVALRTIVYSILFNPIYEGRAIKEVGARGRWFLLAYAEDGTGLVYAASFYIHSKVGMKEMRVL